MEKKQYPSNLNTQDKIIGFTECDSHLGITIFILLFYINLLCQFFESNASALKYLLAFMACQIAKKRNKGGNQVLPVFLIYRTVIISVL